MPVKYRILRRLSHLYKIVESVRSSELAFAEALITETEHEIAAQDAMRCQALVSERSALHGGDGLVWRSAEAAATRAKHNSELLNELRVARELLRDSARNSYRASSVESQQMDQLLKDSLIKQKLKHDKQTQAESDDRGLSRKRWAELQQRG